MGVVYLAHDRRLDRRVAIKSLPEHLHADPVARERLRREAMAAAALDHPFICKVFEMGEADGADFIVMEFVEGETLHQRLSSGRLPQADALRMAGEIGDAMEAAHAQRFVHRDLKPANVMITPQGRVKVMDFGLARQVASHAGETAATPAGRLAPLTELGTRVGTPDYMSPEQALGDMVDERSDLFSFGILLTELLTGTHPFRRDTASATLGAIVADPPHFGGAAAALAPTVLLIIRKLLAKSPGDRYQSMTDVRHDLAALPVSGSGSAASPVTGTGRGSTRFPLVGRDPERAELLDGLNAAIAGRGSLVLIAGEPGIGKTRLTAEVLAQARNRGVFPLVGHCYEMEGAPPYVPFVEMLEHSARTVPPAAFRQALGESAAGVSRLMPELRLMFDDIPAAPELAADQQRRFLFNAYLGLLHRVARNTPVAIVLEDLHWADEPTLMLLQHIVSVIDTMPVFMMGTYRDVELDVRRPFARTLETLLRERRAKRMSLRRLPVQGVESMLASMSGQSPPPSLARVIFDETEGNPFFVEEVFQHLAEEGQLFDDEGAWRSDLRVGELEVPEGVRLVIGRRLQRLAEGSRAVLTHAAVIGCSFALRMLEAVDPNPDAVLDAIEEAERAQLLVGESSGREARYRFAHELIRQTLADGLSMPRRQRLHLRIADAMERIYAASLDKHVSALAHHLFQAGAAADPGRTTTYLRQAAAQARAAAGFEEALVHLDNALALWEDEEGETVARIELERGGVLVALGRGPEGIPVLEKASQLFEALDDVPSMATASVQLGSALAWHGRHAHLAAMTERVLARIGSTNPYQRCRLLAMSALTDAISGLYPQRALDKITEVLELQRVVGDPVLQRDTLAIQAHVAYEVLDLKTAAAVSRRVGAISRERGELSAAVNVEWMAGTAEAYWGRPAEGARVLRTLLPEAERVGHLPVGWLCRSFMPIERYHAGDFTEARRLAEENRTFANSIRSPWVFFEDLMLGMIAHRTGRHDDAVAHMRSAVSAEPQTFWRGIPQAYLFYLLASAGDPSAMEVLNDPTLVVPAPPAVAAAGRWFAVPPVTRGLVLLGDRERAATLRAPLEAMVDAGVVIHYDLMRTSAGIAAAAEGDWVGSERHHRAGVEQADTLDLKVAQPDAREWYARMLMERDASGDRAHAASLLEEAAVMRNALGMAQKRAIGSW